MSDTLPLTLRGIRVSRLISFAMLVSFAAQQFACCCAGACVSVCHEDHAQQAICKTVESWNCVCSHDEHDSIVIAETADRDDDEHPADGHQYHVCVGTHLFYLTVERFDVSRLVLIQGFDLGWSEDFVGLWSMMESSANRDQCADVLFRSAALGRSVLCVYRI
jgi:hypothetical protein